MDGEAANGGVDCLDVFRQCSDDALSLPISEGVSECGGVDLECDIARRRPAAGSGSTSLVFVLDASRVVKSILDLHVVVVIIVEIRGEEGTAAGQVRQESAIARTGFGHDSGESRDRHAVWGVDGDFAPIVVENRRELGQVDLIPCIDVIAVVEFVSEFAHSFLAGDRIPLADLGAPNRKRVGSANESERGWRRTGCVRRGPL